jgi:hypothetical protein
MLEIGLGQGRALVIFGLTVFGERCDFVGERTYPPFAIGGLSLCIVSFRVRVILIILSLHLAKYAFVSYVE